MLNLADHSDSLALSILPKQRRGSAQGSGQASPEWLDGQGLGLQLVELAQAYSDANGLQRGGDAVLTEDSPDFGLFTVWEKLIQARRPIRVQVAYDDMNEAVITFSL
jgi:hypothetical protein